jgi:zinc/manganese transport system substrate-binding protein
MMRLLFAFSLFASLLASSSHVAAELRVVCTISDYCSLVQQIGGDRVTVRALSAVGQDPHYLDPKPSFVVDLHRADLLISNGLELEIGWLPSVVVQARNPKIQNGQSGRFVVAEHISDLLGVPTTAVDRSQGDVHPGGNPHFYHDPDRMARLVPALVERMVRLRPEDKAVFERNGSSLESDLREMVQRIRARFAALPRTQRRVVAYHKSLAYLFATLGLQAVATLEPKPGVAPTPGHVATVLATIKRDRIPAIIQEAHYPQKTSVTVAQLGNAKLVVIPGGTRDGQTYLDQVRQTTDAIYRSLQAKETP